MKQIYPKWLVSLIVIAAIGLSAVPAGSFAGAWSAEVTLFVEGSRGKLFSVAGSNTVGARLMANLLTDYFKRKGAREVKIEPLPRLNEYRVQGLWKDRRVYVDVAAHGSSTGFRGLLRGEAQLAMASRRVQESELEQLSHLGDMDSARNEQVIAIDGLAMIVNRRNPIDSLTLSQIAAVFAGEITNWKALGGRESPINLYARDENSGTWDTFRNLVLGKSHRLSGSARRFESNDKLSDSVADDVNGIGFVGLPSVRRAKALAVSEEEITPLHPTTLVVATEDYALSRRLFLYAAKPQANTPLADFLAYVQSDSGQQVVKQSGFVSQNPISVKAQGQSEGPAFYRHLFRNAERLSVNFRFARDSAELDNKAKRDIQRIVNFMSRPENAGNRLILVGFGDRKQTKRRAVVLSKLRAMAVKSQLFRRGILSEPVLGVGDDLPVAHNLSSGRFRNRRVEVWIERREDGTQSYGSEALPSPSP